MTSTVRAKFRDGVCCMGIVPPKHTLSILKKGILFDCPITKSRQFFAVSFNVTIIVTAITNSTQIHSHTNLENGKNNFSNDEYDFPGGIAKSKDP